MTSPFELLVPIDYRPEAKWPILRAAQVAAEREGRLTLVHVGQDGPDSTEDISSEIGSALVSNVTATHLVVRSGRIAPTLIDIAEQRRCAMIVAESPATIAFRAGSSGVWSII